MLTHFGISTHSFYPILLFSSPIYCPMTSVLQYFSCEAPGQNCWCVLLTSCNPSVCTSFPMCIVWPGTKFGPQDTSINSICHCGHGCNCHLSASPTATGRYVLPPRGPCITTQCTSFQVCPIFLYFIMKTHQYNCVPVKRHICNVPLWGSHTPHPQVCVGTHTSSMGQYSLHKTLFLHQVSLML